MLSRALKKGDWLRSTSSFHSKKGFLRALSPFFQHSVTRAVHARRNNRNKYVMLTVAAALQLVLDQCQPLPPRQVPVAEALGLVLAENVRSDVDSPPHDK